MTKKYIVKFKVAGARMDDTAKNGSCWTRAKDYGKNPLDTKRLRGNVSEAYL